MKIDRLKKLSEANAIAGNENEVRSILKEELNSIADDVSYDKLGSIIFTKQQDSDYNIMLAAHMDEVGFMVKSINGLGLIEAIPIGSIRENARYHQQVIITTLKQRRISGYLVSNVDTLKDANGKMYVDIGVDTKKDVEEMGIQVGDMITFDSKWKDYQPNRYGGKALDDRVGCYIATEVFKRLHKESLFANLHFVATSSEEVGMRGAKTTTNKLHPDIAFVLDVACAKDILQRDESNTRQLGKGPMILHYDKTMIPNRALLQFVKDVASHYVIPYQSDMFSGGGTDGGSIHLTNDGCICIVIGIPLRYGHAPISIADTSDIENTIELLCKIIKHLDTDRIQKMLNFEEISYEF